MNTFPDNWKERGGEAPSRLSPLSLAFIGDAVFETMVRIHNELHIPIIVVEQNSEMALSVADYAYVLEVGNLTLQGSGQQLLQSDEVKNKYLGA